MLLPNEPYCSPTPTPGYRFAGVVLDLQRARLLIDGREVAVGALPLKLLHVVCEAGGNLAVRQTLFDRIWPRQTISDEALSKLISRTRELLDPYGALLITVRGQGLRLDAPVSAFDSSAAADLRQQDAPLHDMQAAIAEDAPRSETAAAAAPWPKSRLFAAAVVVIAMLGALVVFGLRGGGVPPETVIVRGYAIQAADVQNSRPETLDILRLAESAADAGDVMRQRDLLISLHAGDTSSPVAGMLLASIDHSGADYANASRWANEAASRLRADSSVYTRLFIAYVQALGHAPDHGRSALDALVSMRPAAWRLQVRRAHSDLSRRNTAGALATMRNIPLIGTPPTVLILVLDDRIALGDQLQVQEAFRKGLLADAPEQRGYLQAHIMLKQGDRAGAIAKLDDVAILAETNHAFSIAAKAREAAALYAYAGDFPDAATRLASATRKLKEDDMLVYIAEIKMLMAELASESGNAESARRLLKEAETQVRYPDQRLALEMLNARLGLWPAQNFARDDDIAADQWQHGEGSLVRAWLAHARNDPQTATAELAKAQSAGITSTYFAEDAALLSAILSGKDSVCEADPFYPNYLRLSACRALTRLSLRHRALTNAG